MRITMLSARETAHGPLPKLVPLLAAALRRGGWDVDVLPWGRLLEGESRASKAVSRSRDVVAARRAIRRHRSSVVIVHTGHDWSTLARDLVLVHAVGKRGRTIIVQFHGSQSPHLLEPGSRLFKRATAALLRSVDGIFVLSEEERIQWLAFRPGTNVHVVRNPMPDLPPFPEVERAKPPTIICVSRLLAGKGVLDLVRAFAQVRDERDARLVFAGDGPDQPLVTALVRDLNLDGSVELAGHIDAAALARLYAEATVFALPTALPEGFPTAVLEAMAAGLPIVTTGARGPADHLRDGEHALFVPAGDPEAIAEALGRLLGDAGLRSRMADANRLKVLEFRPDAIAAEYRRAIESVVAARS